MNRERFLLKAYGDDVEGTRTGLIKALELLESYDLVVIVVPTIGKVADTMLVDVLGEVASKALIKNREITYPNNKKIQLCGQATLKKYQYADVYLALWGSKYLVSDIERLHKWRGFILVAWSEEDHSLWEMNNKVTVIYDRKHG